MSLYPPPEPPLAVEARSEIDPGTGADVRFAVVLAAGLAVLGAVLGLVWAWWSPAGPRALVIRPGVLQPDETESFVAGDGRFFVIAVLVGLAAGAFAWFRARHRSAVVVLALTVGGVVGSLLMDLVGHLTGGGTFDGAANTLIDSLPLSLHAPGLLLVESAIAVLLYGVLAAFAVRDDLGRADPVRDAMQSSRRPPPPPTDSVGAGDHPQDGGRHGDAAGVLKQGDLPPQ